MNFPSKLPSTTAILAMMITCGALAFFFMIVFVKHYATETIVTQIIQVLSSALSFILGFYFGGMYQKKKMEQSTLPLTPEEQQTAAAA